RSTGFMSTVGASPQAAACTAVARPISAPSAQTAALFDMFWALNGAVRRPRRTKIRHRAATSRLLPTDELVPWTMSVLPMALLATGKMVRVVQPNQDGPAGREIQFADRRDIEPERPVRRGGQPEKPTEENAQGAAVADDRDVAGRQFDEKRIDAASD